MNLDRLLRPRTIAVLGGKPALQVILQNQRLGFAGDIWPVHPSRESIEGRHVYRTVTDLPAVPDAVFLAVNRHETVGIVGALAASGAGGAVCYASGFAEAGAEGVGLQVALRRAAGAMPVLGPNCYGMLNYLDGAALWPDQHGGRRVARGVALITQSGNIGMNLTMQRRGLPIAFVATLGNQAVTGMSHVMAALAEDPRVTAIGLHIEAIDDPAAFAAAVASAWARGKNVVAVKTGASEAGAALAQSHTASMASSDAVTDAFLRHVGVARVRTLSELVEALKLLHVHGRLESADIVSMSCSGGEAALFADRAQGRRARFRPFTQERLCAIAATVPAMVTISNPFDYHTFHWACREALATTFAAVMREHPALIALILDFPRTDRADDTDWRIAADALADAVHETGARAAVVATLPECLPEAHAEILLARGIAPLCGLDEALAAIEAASGPAPTSFSPSPSPHGPAVLLDEWQAKQLLHGHGVAVPPGMRASGAADAVAPSYPAVVKALGIAHKTERAALRLGLADADAVHRAARDLESLGAGLLVEAMVGDCVAEVIVGVARDPALGLYLLLGSGGVLAELVGDRVVLMLPATADLIADAIGSLKVSAFVAGHRGRPPGDRAAAIAAILAIQGAALALRDRLIELDVNPLIVTPTGAVAADALIRLAGDEHA